MGRTTSDNSGNAGQQAPVETILTAGEAIQRGDMVLVGPDSKAYAAAIPGDGSLALQLRPTAGGPALSHNQIGSIIAGPYSWQAAGADSYEVLKLTNGNILLAYVDNGSIPVITILTPDCASQLVSKQVTGQSGAGAAKNVSVAALPNGGFVLGFQTLSAVYLVLYDSAGNVTTAPFVSDPNGSNTVTGVRVAVLSNGNIVTATQQGMTARYSIYTPAGVQVKASTAANTATNVSSGDRSVGVAALAAGGFVVAFVSAPDSSQCTIKSLLFDNAGTAQGAANVLLTVNNPNAFVYVVALTGGGYAVAAYGAVGGAAIAVYSAAGAILGPGVTNLGRISNEVYGNYLALAAAPNGAVGVVYVHATNGLMAAVYSNNGWPSSSPHVIDNTPVANVATASLTFNSDNSAFATSSISGLARVYPLDQSLQASMASWLSGYAPGVHLRSVAVGVAPTNKTSLPCYMLIVQSSATNTPFYALTNWTTRQALTLTGVATAAAASGAKVPVQIGGNAVLRRSFSATWTTNQQGATPPGQRMYVIGTAAFMQGIYANSPKSIN